MSYCLFHLHAGSVRTWATAKLQTTAFSVFTSAWWEENMNLPEDSKLDDLLYVKVTIYFRDYELMHQIMIKRIFYSSYTYAQSHFHSLLLTIMFECLPAPQNRFTHCSGWNLPHGNPSWPSHTITIVCKQTGLFQYAVFRWGGFFFCYYEKLEKCHLLPHQTIAKTVRKTILNVSLYLDLNQKLMGCVLGSDPSSIQVLYESD